MDRDLTATSHHILLCNGGSCMKLGAEEVTLQLRDEIAAQGLGERIHTTRTRCNGRCGDGCVVIVYPDGVWYRSVTPAAARDIVRSLAGGPAGTARISHRYKGGAFAAIEGGIR